MSNLEDISVQPPQRNRFEITLDYMATALAVVMMAFGLRQWSLIVGLPGSPSAFETASQASQIATMYLAVVDLVAAVGLWMRASWGRVVWVVAALTEVAFHTAFAATFGTNLTAVGFHIVTLAAFTAILALSLRGRSN